MKLAIMQPYFFPYIGYFQLINAVDKFVFYDDVNFIKQGWINRNRVLMNGKDFLFIVPIENVSSFTLIKDSYIKSNIYPQWKNKFIKTLEQSYKKAPFYSQAFSIIENILNSNYKTISELAIMSVKQIAVYLNIKTEYIISSERYVNQDLEKKTRLIDICKHEKVTNYINAIGGIELYKKEDFVKEGIQLSFIKSLNIEYKQFNNVFVPWLSIIDVMMFNSAEEIIGMLDKYELV